MVELTARQVDFLWKTFSAEPGDLYSQYLFYENIITSEEYQIFVMRDTVDLAGLEYEMAVFDLVCLLLLDAGETL